MNGLRRMDLDDIQCSWVGALPNGQRQWSAERERTGTIVWPSKVVPARQERFAPIDASLANAFRDGFLC